jgi:hypothetical protein
MITGEDCKVFGGDVFFVFVFFFFVFSKKYVFIAFGGVVCA